MEKKQKRLIEFSELEGECRTTGDSPNSAPQNTKGPEVEVSTKKRHRRFSREYKLSILKKIDKSTYH
ncbi:MAG: hypothetical protein PWQ09_134 [Candidatus Cloacimonadota bacterium]|jgi:hypothetical protein|nr:hypothetical protein [Candidatus Cloacimonadota bacterium]